MSRRKSCSCVLIWVTHQALLKQHLHWSDDATEEDSADIVDEPKTHGGKNIKKGKDGGWGRIQGSMWTSWYISSAVPPESLVDDIVNDGQQRQTGDANPRKRTR